MPSLKDHNGDSYRCKVDSIEDGSVICLVNEKTGVEWICSVTYGNIDEFWALPCSHGGILKNVPCLAVGIVQDVLHEYEGQNGKGFYNESVSLTFNHSPYYMELRVECILRVECSNSTRTMPVKWHFPMVPKAVGDIEKRAAARALEKST